MLLVYAAHRGNNVLSFPHKHHKRSLVAKEGLAKILWRHIMRGMLRTSQKLSPASVDADVSRIVVENGPRETG